MSAAPAPSGTTAASEDLGAPLYVAWQITNECNLACLHCIEESGPGKAFRDELDRGQAFGVIDQLIENQVPYLSFSGGEPMLHRHFFEMVERVTSKGSQLKIETNGHYLSAQNCRRLKDLDVKAVQVSLDGASTATFGRMRVRGEFDTAIGGIRNLAAAGVPIEINFSPASFNVHEAARVVDLAYELGASSFYSGKTMFTGNAVKAWRHLALTDEQYTQFFRTLAAKREEYKGRMRVTYHEAGLLEELRYRLRHPAALLIVLPNGLVKLINALPFVCGDLRTDRLSQVWANFRRAWHDPRVARFVDELAVDPRRTSSLHDWVRV